MAGERSPGIECLTRKEARCFDSKGEKERFQAFLPEGSCIYFCRRSPELKGAHRRGGWWPGSHRRLVLVQLRLACLRKTPVVCSSWLCPVLTQKCDVRGGDRSQTRAGEGGEALQMEVWGGPGVCLTWAGVWPGSLGWETSRAWVSTFFFSFGCWCGG